MIYFQQKPDAVFTVILQAAIERETGRISRLARRRDGNTWEACYPYTSCCFTMEDAVAALHRLRDVTKEPVVYRITDYQWLLLYECLQNFCVEHNDLASGRPDGVIAVGGYELAEIDFDGLVELYFWDTDFLLPAADAEALEREGHIRMTMLKELFGLAPNWQPPLARQRLDMVENPAWRIGAADEWFRQGSYRYPDWYEDDVGHGK